MGWQLQESLQTTAGQLAPPSLSLGWRILAHSAPLQQCPLLCCCPPQRSSRCCPPAQVHGAPGEGGSWGQLGRARPGLSTAPWGTGCYQRRLLGK